MIFDDFAMKTSIEFPIVFQAQVRTAACHAFTCLGGCRHLFDEVEPLVRGRHLLRSPHGSDLSDCICFPMDPSTFLGSVWGIIYYSLEA